MLPRSIFRTVPVRVYLGLLAVALVLPLLAFNAVLLGRYMRAEHTRHQTEAQNAADRTADAMDRELAGITVALQVLGTSPALHDGELPAFEAQARALVDQLGQNVVLMDLNGQQLVNARSQPGSPLPRSQNPASFRAAADQRRPVVLDLFTSTVTNTRLVSVVLPVMRDQQPVYTLTLGVQPDRLASLLLQQNLPPSWVLSVADSTGTIVARSAEQDRYVGQRVPDALRQHMTDDRGVWAGTGTDGHDMLGAYARLRLANWTIAVDVPTEAMEAPLRQGLWWLASTGLLAFALSALLAFGLAQKILRPLRDLLGAARRTGLGELAPRVQSRILEVDEVGQALATASAELHQHTAALRQERARLDAVFATVPVGILLAEAPHGGIVAANPQTAVLLRRPAAEGDRPLTATWDATHAGGRRVLPEEYPLARALHGEPAPELECLLRRGDGTEGWVRLVAAPIRDAATQVIGGVCAMLDLDDVVRARDAVSRFAGQMENQVAERTKDLRDALDRLQREAATRSQVEDQLRQSQKMEAVGRLTGGIAHDFNNLLTVVIGSLDLLRRRLPDGPDRPRQMRLIDGAMEGSQRAATLTSRLLAFSRMQPLQPKALDVNRLVQDMGDLLHRTLGEQVELETVLAGGLWQIHADPNQLESALLNLAVNARDAMLDGHPSDDGFPDGVLDGFGRLTIETGNAYLDDAYCRQNEDLVPGQYVLIAVADTGSGMAADVAAKAFDPFFTTKELGKGTGLGLSQVHGFVKQSGGHVKIYSETRPGPGQGTTMKLYLPRHLAQGPVADEQAQDAPRGGNGELILLVEDEDAVRRLSAAALQELGYQVIEADRAATALRLLETTPGIALLFTDVVLPEVNGRRLADQARALRPGLRVLFTTGYTRNAIVHNGQLDPGVDLVTKPYTLDRLAHKVREVLDRV